LKAVKPVHFFKVRAKKGSRFFVEVAIFKDRKHLRAGVRANNKKHGFQNERLEPTVAGLTQTWRRYKSSNLQKPFPVIGRMFLNLGDIHGQLISHEACHAAWGYVRTRNVESTVHSDIRNEELYAYSQGYMLNEIGKHLYRLKLWP
jgi:hypothetical protein